IYANMRSQHPTAGLGSGGRDTIFGLTDVVETSDPIRRHSLCSELETKGAEFYGGTAALIPTKKPPGSANQSGHWRTSLGWSSAAYGGGFARDVIGITKKPFVSKGDGETVFRHACKLGLEGIVSKRKDSPYRSGRSSDWLKMKNADALAGNGNPYLQCCC